MIDIETIFKYKTFDETKLDSNGFTKEGNLFKRGYLIMNDSFIVEVCIESQRVTYKVVEVDINEEYSLINVASANGDFVNLVREEVEKVLVDISNSCCNEETLRSEQTKRVLEYIKEEYDVDIEFPWDDSESAGIFRVKKNNKWFGIIMSVDKYKLGLDAHEMVEIMNLKGVPEVIAIRNDGKKYFTCYHMSKKHWFSIILDGRLADKEIFELIDVSYNLVEKGKK